MNSCISYTILYNQSSEQTIFLLSLQYIEILYTPVHFPIYVYYIHLLVLKLIHRKQIFSIRIAEENGIQVDCFSYFLRTWTLNSNIISSASKFFSFFLFSFVFCVLFILCVCICAYPHFVSRLIEIGISFYDEQVNTHRSDCIWILLVVYAKDWFRSEQLYIHYNNNVIYYVVYVCTEEENM